MKTFIFTNIVRTSDSYLARATVQADTLEEALQQVAKLWNLEYDRSLLSPSKAQVILFSHKRENIVGRVAISHK